MVTSDISISLHTLIFKLLYHNKVYRFLKDLVRALQNAMTRKIDSHSFEVFPIPS